MEHVEMVQPSALGVVGRTLVFSLLALGFPFMLLLQHLRFTKAEADCFGFFIRGFLST